MQLLNWFLIRLIGSTMVTNIRRFLFAILFAAGSGQGYAVDNTDVAIARVSPVTGAVVYLSRPLMDGDSVHIQYSEPGKSIRCCKILTAKDLQKIQNDDAVINAITGEAANAYQITSNIELRASKIYMGAAGRHINVRSIRGSLESRKLSKKQIIRSCTGAEGINVYAKDGREIASHLYLGLGYSLEGGGTCRATELTSVSK